MLGIVVINVPKNCAECRYNEVDDGCKENICRLLDSWKEPDFDDNSGRYKYCPLRPLPEKQKLIVTGKNQIEKKKIIESKSLEWIKKGYINNPEVAFYCGYNACLDEILGETNHE